MDGNDGDSYYIDAYGNNSKNIDSLYASVVGSFIKKSIGLIFIIISIGLFWWNETNNYDKNQKLKDIKENTIIVTDLNYNSKYEKKILFLQGNLKPISEIKDPVFGVKFNALAVKREVIMYQWYENISNKDGLTEYSYKKNWFKVNINSSTFINSYTYKNPVMKYKKKYLTSGVMLGEYSLSALLIEQISKRKPVENLVIEDTNSIKNIKNYGKFLYIGKDIQNPNIGDIIVRYLLIPIGEYSIIAKLKDKVLVDFVIDDVLNRYLFIKSGKLSIDELTSDGLTNHDIFTWLLRLLGLILIFFGFYIFRARE